MSLSVVVGPFPGYIESTPGFWVKENRVWELLKIVDRLEQAAGSPFDGWECQDGWSLRWARNNRNRTLARASWFVFPTNDIDPELYAEIARVATEDS